MEGSGLTGVMVTESSMTVVSKGVEVSTFLVGPAESGRSRSDALKEVAAVTAKWIKNTLR